MNEEYTKVIMSLIRCKAENREDDYNNEIWRLASLLEKDNKQELAEFVLAQIGIQYFIPCFKENTK